MSPPAALQRGVGAVRRVWGRTPLRIRLVAAVLALVVLALVGSGFAAAATLQHYLLQREDAQLRSAALQMSHGPEQYDERGPGSESNVTRLPSAYLGVVLAPDGRRVATLSNQLVDPGRSLPALPRLTVRQAVARHQQPFTVHAVDRRGQWRVLAVPFPDRSGTLLVATSLGDVEGTVARLVGLELVIGAVALVVIAGVGYLVVRAALRPLRQVEGTAAAIAAGDLGRRVPERDRRTEVGRLGAAINTMLEQIEGSFRAQAASEAEARSSEERMRRFVGDAGHELRTPLTSIRGFAELSRLQDTGQQAPEVSRAMRRIEEEATRMGLLVDDLLLLARLDQERPLRAEPVDLLDLARTVVHDGQVTAPDRTLRLVLGHSDPPPIVTGDPDRLHQVLANLVNNALCHTPPGTPVEVRVATGDGEALVEVIDHGRGLTADESAHVFERFWRADAARSRADGGAGLGLAIVAALVERHRGRVEVDRTPGGGATFRVRLPLDTRTGRRD
ncbi:MAG TPA: HAMP domain-containing sensor histidine kinase [Marmoricola sp.]|nr:HAMP domain-containing sensor histidine kinase [Marmoricola sp.]